MLILSGDIGGTKTVLRLVEASPDGGFTVVLKSSYRSADFSGLDSLIGNFLQGSLQPIDAAAFGVAGPIDHHKCKTTNLAWAIDAHQLSSQLDTNVGLINDFHAVALGIPHLTDSDLIVLQQGKLHSQCPMVVLGAGTGLGEAIIIPIGGQESIILTSEGGHADFAPRNQVEIELLQYLMKRYSHVSVERVLSGPGLLHLYEFVIERKMADENPSVRFTFSSEDPGRVIGYHALAGTDSACEKAVELFMSLYGAEAGNLALKVLPKGGVYVAGGIAPKLVNKFGEGAFLKSFNQKGRMSEVLRNIRVSVVLDPEVGLLGAQVYAMRLAKIESSEGIYL